MSASRRTAVASRSIPVYRPDEVDEIVHEKNKRPRRRRRQLPPEIEKALTAKRGEQYRQKSKTSSPNDADDHACKADSLRKRTVHESDDENDSYPTDSAPLHVSKTPPREISLIQSHRKRGKDVFGMPKVSQSNVSQKVKMFERAEERAHTKPQRQRSARKALGDSTREVVNGASVSNHVPSRKPYTKRSGRIRQETEEGNQNDYSEYDDLSQVAPSEWRGALTWQKENEGNESDDLSQAAPTAWRGNESDCCVESDDDSNLSGELDDESSTGDVTKEAEDALTVITPSVPVLLPPSKGPNLGGKRPSKRQSFQTQNIPTIPEEKPVVAKKGKDQKERPFTLWIGLMVLIGLVAVAVAVPINVKRARSTSDLPPTISPAPSVSSHPTESSFPSWNPSASPVPSWYPSATPSTSQKPSWQPSVSQFPTSTPSAAPSESSAPSLTPSSAPSSTPSSSSAPSLSPSSEPSVSLAPSVTPTFSMAPSSNPSMSLEPSLIPTLSMAPTLTPVAASASTGVARSAATSRFAKRTIVLLQLLVALAIFIIHDG